MSDRSADNFSTRPTSLDAQPLQGQEGTSAVDLGGGGGPGGEPEEGGSSKAVWLVLIAVLLLVTAAAFWWFRGREATPPPQIGAAPSLPLDRPVDEAPEPVDDAPQRFGEAPSLGESDPWLRGLVGALSSHPKIAEWMLNEDLVRTGVKVVANVAFDEDPRVHVPFLRPRGSFDVSADTPTPSSYARYDLLAEVFASLDPEGTAELYRAIQPMTEEAYRELGYPGTFDGALSDALDRLAAVPVLDAAPALERRTLSYHYADPELESLAPAQKLLLRMGPANTVKVQSQIEELRRTLEER